jgi:hypothetical protein
MELVVIVGGVILAINALFLAARTRVALRRAEVPRRHRGRRR